MNDANLTLRDLFSLRASELASTVPIGLRLDPNASALKEALNKTAQGVPWSAVKETISEKILDLLNVPLLEVVWGGWKKLARIMEYADTKKYPPGKTYHVPLAEHKVKSVHHPYIEVLVREQPIAKIHFDIELTLTIEGLELKIESATIKSIQAGTLKGKGTIGIHQTTLAEKNFAPVTLPGALHLGSGIPLTN